MAKTDRIDAELLCEFGKVMRPQTVTAAKLEQEHLRELESQRRHLTHLLVMELNRGARISDACVQRLNRRLIKQIKKQIEQLDLLIKGHIDQSHELSLKAADTAASTGTKCKKSSQTDLDQRSRCAHGSITPGANARAGTTQSA